MRTGSARRASTAGEVTTSCASGAAPISRCATRSWPRPPAPLLLLDRRRGPGRDGRRPAKGRTRPGRSRPGTSITSTSGRRLIPGLGFPRLLSLGVTRLPTLGSTGPRVRLRRGGRTLCQHCLRSEQPVCPALPSPFGGLCVGGRGCRALPRLRAYAAKIPSSRDGPWQRQAEPEPGTLPCCTGVLQRGPTRCRHIASLSTLQALCPGHHRLSQ